MQSAVPTVFVQAWQEFASQCLTVLPHILASLIFLVLGLCVAWIAGRLARAIFRRSSLERRATRLGMRTWLERAGVYSVTAVLARAVQLLIGLVTADLMLYALDATLASELTRQFFLYLPHLAIGIGILVASVWLARVVSRRVLIDAVHRGIRPARLLASLTKSAVVSLGVAVALHHLGIGGAILPIALLIVLGGFVLAASLAVGLGCRDVVRRWIDEQLTDPQATAIDEAEAEW